MLYNSLPALTAVTRLQRLVIHVAPGEEGDEGAVRVVQWAAGIPSLQELAVGVSSRSVFKELSDTMLAAQRNRPNALVGFNAESIDRVFH